jgi:hypothetical protein
LCCDGNEHSLHTSCSVSGIQSSPYRQSGRHYCSTFLLIFQCTMRG